MKVQISCIGSWSLLRSAAWPKVQVNWFGFTIPLEIATHQGRFTFQRDSSYAAMVDFFKQVQEMHETGCGQGDAVNVDHETRRTTIEYDGWFR